MDDKAAIPIGPPNTPIQSVQRQRPTVQSGEHPNLACDHDVAPQHIIPSVTIRLVTTEDNDVDWYSGQPYVGLKCAIFEASNGMLHASELYNKIVDENINSEYLFVLSDGGSDHNVSYVSVQLAWISLFLKLDLDSLLAVRTPPHLSVLNPAERFMSTANLALYGVSLCQDELSSKDAKIVANLRSKTQWRDAANRETSKTDSNRIDVKKLASKSISSAKNILTQRFQRLEYGGFKVKVVESAKPGLVDELITELTSIAPDFNFDKKNLTKAEVMKHPRLKKFYETHCNDLHFSFQLKKCSDNTCDFHKPVRNLDEFKNLHWFPAPEIDPLNNDKYVDFTKLYYRGKSNKPVESCRPSSKPKSSQKKELKKPEFPYVNSKARACVQCGDCGKGRLLYSNKMLKNEEKLQLEQAIDFFGFFCGCLIFDEDDPMNAIVYQHHLNDCCKPMSAMYFSQGPKCLFFKLICPYCFEMVASMEKSQGLPKCRACKYS